MAIRFASFESESERMIRVLYFYVEWDSICLERSMLTLVYKGWMMKDGKISPGGTFLGELSYISTSRREESL
jgi:hypothetical protein